MARMKTMKSIDAKIVETEDKLRKSMERCEKLSSELDGLYREKTQLENEELLDAIGKSSRTKSEIIAFLESR